MGSGAIRGTGPKDEHRLRSSGAWPDDQKGMRCQYHSETEHTSEPASQANQAAAFARISRSSLSWRFSRRNLCSTSFS
jgi:hypothetical protein